MRHQLSGLRDKLYWRKLKSGLWCCFKKASGGYISLCECAPEIPKGKLGGQDCRRPAPIRRHARCDVLEMKRRGWSESGPTLHPKPKTSSVTYRKTKKGTTITFRGEAANDIFKAMEGKL